MNSKRNATEEATKPDVFEASKVGGAPLAPRGVTRRRKRWFLWALVLLLAAGGTATYLWMRSTPEYAIRNIRAALAERDGVRFRSFVDADAVIAAAVAAYRPPADRQVEEAGLFARLKEKVARLTNLDQTQHTKAINAALTEFFTSAATAPAPAANETLHTVLLRHLPDVGRTLTLKQALSEPQQVVARVQFLLSAYGDVPVEARLRFQRERGKLRLVEIANFAEVARAIRAAEMDWKRDQNAGVENEIRQTLKLLSLGIGKREETLFGNGRKLTMHLSVEGLQVLPVLSLEGELTLQPRGGKAHDFHIDVLLGATGKAMQSHTRFALGEETGTPIPEEVWKAGGAELIPKLRITAVRFVNGKRLGLPYPEVD